MSTSITLSRRWLAALLLALALPVQAAEPLVTRAFSGIWDQPDQQSQGLILQIADLPDDSKNAVVYWFTYAGDLESAWYFAVGEVDGNTVQMTLYSATGVGFMQDGLEGNPAVSEIGTLELEFRNCNHGVARYATGEDVLGSGEFRIHRLTRNFRTRCTGGISDDTREGVRPSRLDVELQPARDDISGAGKAMFWERSERSDFKVFVRQLPDGVYELLVCGEDRGDIEVIDGSGHADFRSPASDEHALLDFDPRDCTIEVADGSGAALTSGDAVLSDKGDKPAKPDHPANMRIEAALESSGLVDGAEGSAEYRVAGGKVEFNVTVTGLPAGDYPLVVGGSEAGVIEVRRDGSRSQLNFRDPARPGAELLDFDPLGQVIEVLFGGEVVLDALFPDA
jgi:hypothetical protein